MHGPQTSGAASPKVFWGQKLRGQTVWFWAINSNFVWDATSQSPKWQDTLKILGDTWPLGPPSCAYASNCCVIAYFAHGQKVWSACSMWCMLRKYLIKSILTFLTNVSSTPLAKCCWLKSKKPDSANKSPLGYLWLVILSCSLFTAPTNSIVKHLFVTPHLYEFCVLK